MSFLGNERHGNTSYGRRGHGSYGGGGGSMRGLRPHRQLSIPPWRRGGIQRHDWDAQNYTTIFPDQGEIRFALIHADNRDNSKKGENYTDVRNKTAANLKSNLRINALYNPDESVINISMFYSKGTSYSFDSNDPEFESLWWIMKDFDHQEIQSNIIGRFRLDMNIVLEPFEDADLLAKTIRLEDPEWSFYRRTGSWEVTPYYSASLKVKKVEHENKITSSVSDIRKEFPSNLGNGHSSLEKSSVHVPLDPTRLAIPSTRKTSKEIKASTDESAMPAKALPGDTSRVEIGKRKISRGDIDKGVEDKTGMTVEIEPKEVDTGAKPDKVAQGKKKKFIKRKSQVNKEKIDRYPKEIMGSNMGKTNSSHQPIDKVAESMADAKGKYVADTESEVASSETVKADST